MPWDTKKFFKKLKIIMNSMKTFCISQVTQLLASKFVITYFKFDRGYFLTFAEKRVTLLPSEEHILPNPIFHVHTVRPLLHAFLLKTIHWDSGLQRHKELMHLHNHNIFLQFAHNSLSAVKERINHGTSGHLIAHLLR